MWMRIKCWLSAYIKYGLIFWSYQPQYWAYRLIFWSYQPQYWACQLIFWSYHTFYSLHQICEHDIWYLNLEIIIRKAKRSCRKIGYMLRYIIYGEKALISCIGSLVFLCSPSINFSNFLDLYLSKINIFHLYPSTESKLHQIYLGVHCVIQCWDWEHFQRGT